MMSTYMAILALTLLAIFWGVLFLPPLLHEFFNFSLLRSRLPVELADDLRLKISEFWKRNGKKNIEKYLLYDNDMMRMIFSHDILKSNIRRHISYYSNIIMNTCTMRLGFRGSVKELFFNVQCYNVLFT